MRAKETVGLAGILLAANFYYLEPCGFPDSIVSERATDKPLPNRPAGSAMLPIGLPQAGIRCAGTILGPVQSG